MLPTDVPPMSSVRYYFDTWNRDGTFIKTNDTPRKLARHALNRDPEPSISVLDSQSVKTTESGGERGDDGGKQGQRAQTAMLGWCQWVLGACTRVSSRHLGYRFIMEQHTQILYERCLSEKPRYFIGWVLRRLRNQRPHLKRTTGNSPLCSATRPKLTVSQPQSCQSCRTTLTDEPREVSMHAYRVEIQYSRMVHRLSAICRCKLARLWKRSFWFACH
jgi:hypothetical protein